LSQDVRPQRGDADRGDVAIVIGDDHEPGASDGLAAVQVGR
jgi:hypothetical protein